MSNELTFQEKVDLVVKGITTNADGVSILPEDIGGDDVKVAVTAEKRRRDTQSAYTKAQVELKSAKQENEKLKKLLKPELKLTSEQKEELLDLKGTDPDKWKDKLDSYNTEAQAELDKNLVEVSENSEINRRALVLQDFIEANEGFEINDKVLNEDIPSKMKQKLVDGVVTFEAFLVEARDYLEKTNKREPDLNSVGGSTTPTDDALKADIRSSYNNEVY